MNRGVLLNLAPGPGRSREAALERAAGVLRKGGVVSFATDTFYALGADPLNDAAVERVFRIKRRRRRAPLPVLVRSFDQAEAILGGRLPRSIGPMLEACWPGPLTVVLPARRQLPDGITGPDGSLGLRWPGGEAAQALLERFGGAITGSSANRSGGGEPTSGAMVAEVLGGEIDLILETGPSPGGPGSTVIRLVEVAGRERIQLIREGRLSLDRLQGLSGLDTESIETVIRG